MRARKTNRRGVTLIELLIVATIMLVLMVVSVPLLKPMLESQATSNAATVVSTYLNRARSRAIMTGRPCGVRFEVWDGSYGVDDRGDTDATNDLGYAACLVLRQVEVPPVYSGLTDDATVSVVSAGSSATLTINDSYWNTITDKQKIQFNNMGPYYPFNGNDTITTLGELMSAEIPNIATPGVPFKILRAPKPTMTAPVGLPQGTVVDLTYSGGIDELCQDRTMTIMFSPGGEVDNVVYGNNDPKIPSHTIYLMIGRWERITAFSGDVWNSLEEDQLTNFADGTCFWVTVNPRTGMVSTAEVNPDIEEDPNITNPTKLLLDTLSQSREFATESKRNTGGY